MQTYARPPHYLTDTDFDRLRLSDEQYLKMEKIILDRPSADRAQLLEDRKMWEARAKTDLEADRVARPVISLVAGMFFALLFYELLEMVLQTNLGNIHHQPLSLVFWTYLAARMMRKK